MPATVPHEERTAIDTPGPGALGRTQDEARRLAVEDLLREARAESAELRAAVALREAFIASIGHELRNPMVPILLCVERLRALSASGDHAKLAGGIAVLGHATDAFMRRASQLLDISRLGNTGFLLRRCDCDLSAIVRDTVDRHREIARRAGCDLTLAVASAVRGWSDQAALEQLLDNLLSNAFKYGAGRPVSVRLERLDLAVTLSVSDRGEGIEAGEQAQIFGLFKRARDPGAPGLGIGLWIAGRLAEAMDGTLSVDSVPGQGATFTLTLPRQEFPPPNSPEDHDQEERDQEERERDDREPERTQAGMPE